MSKRRTIALMTSTLIGLGGLFIATPAAAEHAPPPLEQSGLPPETRSGAEADAGAGIDATADPVEKPETTEPAGPTETTAPVETTEAGSQGEPERAERPEPLDEKALRAISSAQAFEAETGGEAVASGENADGELVLLASRHEMNEKVVAFAEAAENGETEVFDEVLFTEPAVAYGRNDLVGGAGYVGSYLCSVGFAAWDPNGRPAAITAGHCAGDSALGYVDRTRPANEPAVGGRGDEYLDELGRFAVARFGGPASAADPGAQGDPQSTDIAAIRITNEDLRLVPGVTNWRTAYTNDLSAGLATRVRGVADPEPGPIAKSGRTTGYTTGTTDATFLNAQGEPVTEEILDGWIRVSGRWVHGFIAGLESAGGDSGGAVFQGDRAVGVVSGGPSPSTGETWVWATRLKDALELDLMEGYEVALDIDRPVVGLKRGAKLEPGERFTVEIADNAAHLEVYDGTRAKRFAARDGEISVAAPKRAGDHTLGLVAVNGHSSSALVEVDITVRAEQSASPQKPTSPAPPETEETPEEQAQPAPIRRETLAKTGANPPSLAWTVGYGLVLIGAASILLGARRPSPRRS